MNLAFEPNSTLLKAGSTVPFLPALTVTLNVSNAKTTVIVVFVLSKVYSSEKWVSLFEDVIFSSSPTLNDSIWYLSSDTDAWIVCPFKSFLDSLKGVSSEPLATVTVPAVETDVPSLITTLPVFEILNVTSISSKTKLTLTECFSVTFLSASTFERS